MKNKKKSLSALNRVIFDSINNFFIDTDEIIFIEEDLYNSFTFPIHRKDYDKNIVENLVYSLNSNGDYETFISKYELTDFDRYLLSKNLYVDVLNKSLFKKINAINVDFLTNRIDVIANDGTCWEANTGASQGTGTEQVISYSQVSCISSSGGGAGGSLSPSQPNYNGSQGSIGNNNYPGSVHSSQGSYNNGYSSNTTGGVYGNGSTYTIPSLPHYSQVEVSFKFHKKYIAINPTLETWWTNPLNENTINQICEYLYSNQNPELDEQDPNEFAVWCVTYYIANPNTTTQQFQNWFLIKREGKDGDFDESYWNNPNLTFPQQNLPSFDDFDAAYPREDGVLLIQLIGGDVQQAYTDNPDNVRGYCALKVSRGLNNSGITIPNLPGKTIKGGDNKYYFLNAKALNKWMRKTFGISPNNPNHLHIDNTQIGTNGENLPALTAGIKGIYSLVSSNPNWASGNADLINDGTCVFGCHFNNSPIDYIDIWVLN